MIRRLNFQGAAVSHCEMGSLIDWADKELIVIGPCFFQLVIEGRSLDMRLIPLISLLSKSVNMMQEMAAAHLKLYLS